MTAESLVPLIRAAEMVGIPYKNLHHRVRQGSLQVEKINGRLYVTPEQIDELQAVNPNYSECNKCGAVFVASHNFRTRCADCQGKPLKEPKKLPEAQCATCGIDLPARRNANKQYCSRSCYRPVANARMSEIRQSKRLFVYCNLCGSRFTRYGHNHYCDECRNAFPSEIRSDLAYRGKYGMSLLDIRSIWYEQEGKCRVCSAPLDFPGPNAKKLHVDHDHECCPVQSGCKYCVRGLLCAKCNIAIGNLDDSIPLLISAIKHLMNPLSVQNWKD